MSENKISIEDVKELATLLKQNNLSEISVTDREFTINLKSSDTNSSGKKNIVVGDINHVEEQVVEFKTETASTSVQTASHDGNKMLAPIVGTFYSSPAPDKPPFVTVGSKVQKGDILFIIESMKLMNEIPSEFDGEVVQVITSDGDAVEYNQPVMVIK